MSGRRLSQSSFAFSWVGSPRILVMPLEEDRDAFGLIVCQSYRNEDGIIYLKAGGLRAAFLGHHQRVMEDGCSHPKELGRENRRADHECPAFNSSKRVRIGLKVDHVDNPPVAWKVYPQV